MGRQRIRSIADDEATGVVREVYDVATQSLESEEYNERQRCAVAVTARMLDEYACRICRRWPDGRRPGARGGER